MSSLCPGYDHRQLKLNVIVKGVLGIKKYGVLVYIVPRLNGIG